MGQRVYGRSKLPSLQGARLKKEALYFKINEASIADLSQLDIDHLA